MPCEKDHGANSSISLWDGDRCCAFLPHWGTPIGESMRQLEVSLVLAADISVSGIT